MKNVNFITKKENKHCVIFFIFIISFLLHLIPIIIIKTPTSGPDEVISLASAARISGKDWSYLVTKFGTWYGCGSAWFLAPLFCFISNGRVIYNLARGVLAIFLALQSVVCYKILRDFLECDNELEVIIVSLLGSFLSNVTADIFCNEAVLTLGTWLIIYFILIIYKKGNSFRYTLLVMAILAYCYISHTRALIYLVPICMTSIYLSIKKKKSFFDIRAIIVSGTFFFVASKINEFVSMNLYNNKEALDEIDSIAGKTASNYGLLHNYLLTIHEYGLIKTIRGILCISVTNMYALLIFSCMSVALAFVCWLTIALKREKSCKDNLVNIIGMFCVIGLGISILAMGIVHCWHGIYLFEGNIYGDGRFFFYLRYYINFLPPLIIPIYICLKNEKSSSLMLRMIVLSFIVYFLFRMFFFREISADNIAQFDVGKLFEALTFGKKVDYSIAFKICLLINAILIFIDRKSNKKVYYFIAIFLMIVYQKSYQCVMFRGSISGITEECTNKFVKVSQEKEIRNYLDSIGEIYIYSNKVYRLEYYIQLVMPEISVKRFQEGNQDEIGNDKVVFSNEKITLSDGKKAYEIVLDDNEFLYTDSYDIYFDLLKLLK